MYIIYCLKKTIRIFPVWVIFLMGLGILASCADDGSVGPQGETGAQGESGEDGEDGDDGNGWLIANGYFTGTITSTDNLNEAIDETFQLEYTDSKTDFTYSTGTDTYSQSFYRYGSKNYGDEYLSIYVYLEKDGDGVYSPVNANVYFNFVKVTSDEISYDINQSIDGFGDDLTITNYVYDLNTAIVTFDYSFNASTEVDGVERTVSVSGSFNSGTNVYLYENTVNRTSH